MPAGPINDVAAALDDPHVRARGMVQAVEHPTAGRIDLLGPVAKFSRTPATVRLAPPPLGYDTAAILRELARLLAGGDRPAAGNGGHLSSHSSGADRRMTNAFIPEDRRRALAAHRTLPVRAHGSALFADISGFTPLTEALARQLGQRRGAEVLTHQLNLVYSALITAVEAWQRQRDRL